MKKNKRLFLFAIYDKDNIIDDALVHYVSQVAKHGDVIVCTDCDCKKSEIQKLKPYTIHTISGRHGEYDFGSYKRAYQYARDKNILKNYDTLYLINDSVFGPLIDIEPTLHKIEQLNTDAAGIVVSKHKTHIFMESWFIRLNKKVFLSKWFDEFISNVEKQSCKTLVTIKYEHGLTTLVQNNHCSWGGIYTYRGRTTYNKPKQLFKHGCPFVKKISFTRHNGGLGNQIKYILKHSKKSAVESVISTSNRLYGEKYMKWFLTFNPFKIILRNTKYAIQKFKNGGI